MLIRSLILFLYFSVWGLSLGLLFYIWEYGVLLMRPLDIILTVVLPNLFSAGCEYVVVCARAVNWVKVGVNWHSAVAKKTTRLPNPHPNRGITVYARGGLIF